METPFDSQMIDTLVSRVMATDDITAGTAKSPYLVRYRGHLRSDPEIAYDQLAGWLKSYNLTPLFRWDEDRHAILIVPGVPQPRPSNPMINLLMAFLTLISVLWVGASSSNQGELPTSDPMQFIILLFANGWPYAVSLLAILGTHEFGHYLAARYHGVHVTLPYFIPMPPGWSPIGTMGAFIQMKENPKNRKILLDIGIAGPLAGLVVSIVVLLIGLSLSQVGPLQITTGEPILMEGNSILYLFSKFMIFGKLLPEPSSFGDISPILYWLRYFFTSTPSPIGGIDVNLNSVAWAGWVGMLVTAMNLIPAGQLDGGHMLYVLLGRERAKKAFPFVLGGLVILGAVWTGWWIWAALIFMLGRTYAEPLDQITPLDNRRKILAIVALFIFLLTFSPVPFSVFG